MQPDITDLLLQYNIVGNKDELPPKPKMPKGKPRSGNVIGMAQYMASSAYKAYEQYKLQYNMFMARRRQILKKKHNQEQIVRTGDRHNGPRPEHDNVQRTPRRRAQHSARQPSRRAINAHSTSLMMSAAFIKIC